MKWLSQRLVVPLVRVRSPLATPLKNLLNGRFFVFIMLYFLYMEKQKGFTEFIGDLKQRGTIEKDSPGTETPMVLPPKGQREALGFRARRSRASKGKLMRDTLKKHIESEGANIEARAALPMDKIFSKMKENEEKMVELSREWGGLGRLKNLRKIVELRVDNEELMEELDMQRQEYAALERLKEQEGKLSEVVDSDAVEVESSAAKYFDEEEKKLLAKKQRLIPTSEAIERWDKEGR